ncbi:hypothetical protein [Glutamicibacter sp. NPDC087583]|uniref:hypothetical protein n=1 Tax=Glutamicibacter sp. NPDC087583 TaxID=3363995 RepID=UPI0037FE189C
MSTKAPTKLEEFQAKLEEVHAVSAIEFGEVFYGWGQANTAMMIQQGRFPLPTWQNAPRGKHYVSTQSVREHFAKTGISL